MTYYYEGRDGDSFVDATIHHSEDCEELGEPVRPIADSTVEAYDVDKCSQCSPLESASGSDSDAAELIEEGVCPWCSDYEGDHVGQHASSAHEKEWNDYHS